MRASARVPRGGPFVIAAVLLALTPAVAGAATQTRTDPSDAPVGPQGKADLRSLSWDVDGAAAKLDVSLDASTYEDCTPDCKQVPAQLGLRVFIDTNADGIADAQIVAARNPNGSEV